MNSHRTVTGDILRQPTNFVIAAPCTCDGSMDTPILNHLKSNDPRFTGLYVGVALCHTLFIGGTVLFISPAQNESSYILLPITLVGHTIPKLDDIILSIRSLIIELKSRGLTDVAIPVMDNIPKLDWETSIKPAILKYTSPEGLNVLFVQG